MKHGYFPLLLFKLVKLTFDLINLLQQTLASILNKSPQSHKATNDRQPVTLASSDWINGHFSQIEGGRDSSLRTNFIL